MSPDKPRGFEKFRPDDLPGAKPGFRFEKIIVTEFSQRGPTRQLQRPTRGGKGGPDDGGLKGPRMKWAPP